jgi:hypothetical protein
MRVLRIAAVLLSVLAVDVTAQSTPTGIWCTVVLPRIEQPRDARMPKMFGEVLLDLKAEDAKLTGTARMGDGWPGTAPIQDGKIEGNRFSFTWTGTLPSSGGVPLQTSSPHLTFAGTVDGDQMKLSMDGRFKMELKGERLTAERSLTRAAQRSLRCSTRDR